MKALLKSYKLIAAFMVIVVSGLGIFIYDQAALGHGDDEEAAAPQKELAPTSVPVETASDGGLSALGASTVSWPGEILSTTDVQIYPSREGQIAEWLVRLGDTVKKGQVIGRLTPPPATIELASALAERSQALVRARAQAAATEKLVQSGKARLAVLKEKLDRSRDTALALIDTEAEKNLQSAQGAGQQLRANESEREAAVGAAQAEVTQAQALVPLKRQATRVAFERLATRFPGAISINGIAPSSPELAAIQFNRFYGISNLSTRDEFIWSLQALLRALKDPAALPEKEAFSYTAAAQKLLAASFADEQELTSAKLNEVRDIITDDKDALLTALKEYKEAETALVVAQSILTKTMAQTNNQVVGAQVAAASAQLTVSSTERQKQNKVAETDLEFSRESSDLDGKIAELEREASLAYAEVRSAEAAYGILASGVGGQMIVAPRSGVISALYKNTGDHVDTQTAVAAIGNRDAQGKFVRFRIPSDSTLPNVGDLLTIERPGFPLQGEKVKLIGIGLSLDAQGAYAADAELVKPLSWPVHASVRVLPPKNLQAAITVPFTAIWWKEESSPQVWLVMENNVIRPQTVRLGKAFGDRITIEEGLEEGDRFVSRASDGLKTGQSVAQTTGSTPTTTKPAASEEAGHSHNE